MSPYIAYRVCICIMYLRTLTQDDLCYHVHIASSSAHGYGYGYGDWLSPSPDPPLLYRNICATALRLRLVQHAGRAAQNSKDSAHHVPMPINNLHMVLIGQAAYARTW